MDVNVIFVGTKYLYNESLKEYALRNIKKNGALITSLKYYKDGDNSLFLDLESELNKNQDVLIIASKNNYTTVAKLICTITQDNLVLQEDTLIPSKTAVYEKGSFLLEYNEIYINVIALDEKQKMPQILLNIQKDKTSIQLFFETMSNAKILLDTLSQTYEVKLEFVELIEGWIEIHISSGKYGNISKFIASAKKLLPNKIIESNDVVAYIIDVLSKKDKKITFAESCTGGLLSYFLTKNNGASKILEGSLITYSNQLKENWLAVSEDVFEKYGAVSQECVEQMSEGALNVSGADYAISISGIAGDSGGSAEKPVGTVYIGVRNKEKYIYEHLLLQGDRNDIQYQSVLYAIKLLVLSDIETFF